MGRNIKMRPVPNRYKMHFGFGELYPPELQYLTSDKKHHGQDFLTPIGTTVGACVDGVVNFIGWKRGYGNCIYIKFFTGNILNRKTYRLILAHLSKITTDKKVGQKVSKYNNVALSGDSGMAIGHPHLHLEVQLLTNGIWVPVNPQFVTGEA
jgi:murein DD-endopeptidase MepM/ murein hydrolase activator NlpD